MKLPSSLAVLIVFLSTSNLFAQQFLLLRVQIAGLITALDKDSTKQIDLTNMTGRDFGPRPELWQKWLNHTSDEQLEQIAERIRTADQLDLQWNELEKALSARSWAVSGTYNPSRPNGNAVWEQLQQVSSEPDAWDRFFKGAYQLTWSGDRESSAKTFKAVFEQSPLSHYSAIADELSFLLSKMVEEDKAWVEPKTIDQLTVQEKIRYYVYHLRDAPDEQSSGPGMLFRPKWKRGGDQYPNTAIDLKELGEEAVPTLLDLLDDRRPIRSFKYCHTFWPEYSVLRYQDVAARILDEVLPVPFYQQLSQRIYLSKETVQNRLRIISLIREWHQLSQGKSESDKLWTVVWLKPGIGLTLEALQRLGTKYGKQEVLNELHLQYDSSPNVCRPLIVEVMMELGDDSKAEDVVQMLERNEFSASSKHPVEEQSLYMSAELAAERIAEKYRNTPPDSPDNK